MSASTTLSSFAEAALRLYSRVAPTERGGYRLARAVRRLRQRQDWRDTFRTPDGLVLDLDLAAYPDVCMAFGLYELDSARVIKRLLRPGDHFVDGGANLGYFTLLAASRVGPAGRVDAFEPEPGNRSRLVEHLRRNRGEADVVVTVHPVALSDRAGEAVIHLPLDASGNHGSSSLFPEPGGHTRATAVPTVRLDERLGLGARPALIKLDVEGAEPLAVAGMTGLLAGPTPPALLIEHNPPTARAAGFAPREFVDRVLAAQPRYGVWAVGPRLHRLDPADARAWARLGQVNLLFRV